MLFIRTRRRSRRPQTNEVRWVLCAGGCA